MNESWFCIQFYKHNAISWLLIKQEGDGPIYEHATMVTVLSLIMRSNTQMGQIWNLQPKLPWIYVHIANNFVGLLRPW